MKYTLIKRLWKTGDHKSWIWDFIDKSDLVTLLGFVDSNYQLIQFVQADLDMRDYFFRTIW